MSFTSIIGQPLAVDLAKRWLAKETTNPLLFYGPAGVGKRALALELAKALNCKGGEAPHQDSCGSCQACRKIATGNHPDVRVIDLAWQAAQRDEPLEKQLALRMETVLEERRRLLQSAVEGAWKVTIIDDVHKLTPDAANVLLKTLEEPPERTALILLTPFRDRLFATILSRCQPVRFRPLSDTEMERCLSAQGIAAEDRRRLMELALGSPGRALQGSREEELQAAEEAETLWENRRQATPARILGRSEGRGRGARPARAEIEKKLLHLLTPAVRDLRRGNPGAAPAVQQIERALQQLRQNVQPALAYENCLLQLRTLP